MPVYAKRAELQKALKESDVVIVTAGTGCGKSTQLPQYIIADDFYTHTPILPNDQRHFVRICCTQPRRLAAQGVAKRVADEYLTSLGKLVGFRVGKRGSGTAESQKVCEITKIEFVTEGLLLYQLTKSPQKLSNYNCIIVDEAHERNKETDLLLALLRRYLNDRPPNVPKFKLVVMSATIDPTEFSNYFDGCPIVDCPGKVHPVEKFYCPPAAIACTDNNVKGDVLIFLSGSAQISVCVDKINSKAQKRNMPFVVAYPLYAQMPEKDKQDAKDPKHRTGFDKVTDGRHKYSRKIICCTNIAETSLTIDMIRFVIEGGHAKRAIYDHSLRSKSLVERKVSLASAKERKGRAGRTAPGRCYYLYDRSFAGMKEFDVPQIMDTPVDELIVYSLNVCGESIDDLGLMDCPDKKEIIAAKERLSDLGLIEIGHDESVSLTEDGKIACALSAIEPQGVRMMLSARAPEIYCLHRAIKFAVILSCEENIFFSRENGANEDELFPSHDLGDHFLALDYFEKTDIPVSMPSYVKNPVSVLVSSVKKALMKTYLGTREMNPKTKIH
eukprot:scaffold85671_cov54-Attheya_sp.AAC.5